MLKLFFKLFRKELTEGGYDVVFGVLYVFVSLCIAYFLNSSYQVCELNSSDLFSTFITINLTLFAISVAISAFIASRIKSRDYNDRVLNLLKCLLRQLGVFSIVIIVCCSISIAVSYKTCSFFNLLVVCMECLFLIMSIISIILFLDPQWSIMVQNNIKKMELRTESIKQLKSQFRKLCDILDGKAEGFAFYGQVDNSEELTTKQKKFLKELYQEIDNTKIGCLIKDPEDKMSQLGEIINKIKSEDK